MKRAYTKPEIFYESFSLSQNIAAGCEAKTNTPAAKQCAVDFSGKNVFLSGMDLCTDIQVDDMGGDGDFNGFCYHVFSDGEKNFFNS